MVCAVEIVIIIVEHVDAGVGSGACTVQESPYDLNGDRGEG